MTEQLEQTLTEQLVEALEPFAEVYGRRSKLVRGTRGMNQVAKGHRVGLISEQSDGHFGYLPISAFRDAELALDRARTDPEEPCRHDRHRAKDWPSGTFPRSSYITLEFGQMNEGEMTLFARHSMYGDLIAGLEDAARQLREVVVKEMVQTWGFPICARTDPEALLRENGEAVRRTGNALMVKRGKGK